MAQSIEAGKAQVLQTKEECRTKEGELAVKNNKLADLQVEVKLLTLRKGILQEQNDSLVKTKEQLVENLVCLGCLMHCLLIRDTKFMHVHA